MITSIYSSFASIKLNFYVADLSLFFFLIFIFVSILGKNFLVSALDQNERILLLYNHVVICKYIAHTIHIQLSIVSFFFLFLSYFSLIFLCCKAISHSLPLTRTTTAYQIHQFLSLFYRQNQLYQPTVKFRAHPAASFPFLCNPSYSFAYTKAKAKFISIHSLFVFFIFSFFYYSLTLSLPLLILGDHNATRTRAR